METASGSALSGTQHLQLVSGDPVARLTRRAERGRREWRGYAPLALLENLKREPAIGDALCQLGDELRPAIEPRTLAMVVLRVACVMSCEYLWAQAYLAHENNVLSYAEIVALAGGPDESSADDAAVLAAVDELLADGRLTDSSSTRLGARALGVKIAVGTYQTFAYVAQDLAPEPGVPVLAGIESPAKALETYLAHCAGRREIA